MGDADVTNLTMPVREELEDLLDDAMSVMDDRIDSGLLFLLTFLHVRTSYIATQLISWGKFRRCFNALNLFLAPIILAFGIAYLVTALVEPNSAVEAGFEALVAFLLYLSGIVGFPLYVVTLWKAYISDTKMKDICMGREISNDNETEGDSTLEIMDEMSISDVIESFERISEFRRLIGRRSSGSSRLDNEGRESRFGQDQQESLASREISDVNEMPKNNNDKDEPKASHKLVDLDFDMFSRADSPLSEATSSALLLEERDDDYDLKVIILNAREDLSVEIEKSEENGRAEVEKNGLSAIATTRPPEMRNIPIENIGEKDNRKTTFMDDNSSSANDFALTKQGFGL